MSPLIFTAAQKWSCSAADVSSHLHFRTELMLRSGFFLVFFGWGGVLGGWVGVITNVAFATQLDLHLHFMLRCWCLLSSSLPHRIDHALLLMSSLIFTSAQNWSCSAADVSSHLHFRTGLLRSGFFSVFFGGGEQGHGSKSRMHPEMPQLVSQFMWRHSLGSVSPEQFLDFLCKEFAKRDDWMWAEKKKSEVTKPNDLNKKNSFENSWWLEKTDYSI